MSIQGVNSNSAINDILSDMKSNSHTNIQFLYAKLQLTQSQLCHQQAEEYIKKIEETQAEQKLCADMIAKARDLQNQAKNDDKSIEMPQDMIEYFEKHNLKWDTKGNDNFHTKDEWEYNIKSLTNFQETLGTTSQTDMVFLQDLMGQYNSFLQGANKSFTDANQTLQSIATR